MRKKTQPAELILNKDGSIYHLHLHPENIADDIILVGDPGRVGKVSRHLDRVELKISAREFVTHTGWLGKRRISVVSTGIGTDNVDIVLHELDALANLDLGTGVPLRKRRTLNFIRVGTSGALQPDIPVDSLLVSEAAMGFDALGNFYQSKMSIGWQQRCSALQSWLALPSRPYAVMGDRGLIRQFGSGMLPGITVTAPGFYAPQGRCLRIRPRHPELLSGLQSFRFGEDRLTNMEMETAGLYLLTSIMGHRAVSLNAILANRATGRFSTNPEKIVRRLIGSTLERL